MKVQILKGTFIDRLGILEKENDYGKWSSIHIEREAIVYLDKTYLRKIENEI